MSCVAAMPSCKPDNLLHRCGAIVACAAALLFALSAACVLSGCDKEGSGDTGLVSTSGANLSDPTQLNVICDINSAMISRETDDNGEYVGDPVGFEAELVTLLCTEMGLTPAWHYGTGTTALLSAVVEDASVDAALSSIVIEQEREEDVVFTDAYYTAQMGLYVLDGSGYDSRDSFTARDCVAVLEGSAGQTWAQENLKAAIVGFTSERAMFAALRQQVVQGVVAGIAAGNTYGGEIGDWEDEYGLSYEFSNTTVTCLESVPTGVSYGMAVSGDNEALAKALNKALEKLKQGSAYDDLVMKYYGADDGNISGGQSAQEGDGEDTSSEDDEDADAEVDARGAEG